MTGYQQALSDAEQMAGFAAAHPSADPRWEGWLSQLEETIARTRGHKLEQQRAAKAWRDAMAKRKELRCYLHDRTLPYLTRAASYRLPELAGKFRRPRSNASYRSFLTQIRRMLRLFDAHAEELKELSQEILQDHRASVRAFEEAYALVATSRRERARASAGLRNSAAKLLRVYWNLEAIYIMELDDFRESLKQWAAQRGPIARREERTKGTLRLIS